MLAQPHENLNLARGFAESAPGLIHVAAKESASMVGGGGCAGCVRLKVHAQLEQSNSKPYSLLPHLDPQGSLDAFVPRWPHMSVFANKEL